MDVFEVGVTVGFCGSLTTFSSFIVEAIQHPSTTPPYYNSFGLAATKIWNTSVGCFCSWLIGRWIAQTMKNQELHKAILNDNVLTDDVIAALDLTVYKIAKWVGKIGQL